MQFSRKNVDDNISLTKILQHPEFKPPSSLSADIAFLTLDKPITFSNVAVPICLPASSAPQYAGEKASMVAGWGAIDRSQTIFSDILKKVKLNVLKNSECNKLINNARMKNATKAIPKCCDAKSRTCPEAFPIKKTDPVFKHKILHLLHILIMIRCVRT